MKKTLLSLTWWNPSTTLEIVSTLMATFQKWTCKSTLSSNRLLTRNFLKKILFTFLRLIYRLNFLFLKMFTKEIYFQRLDEMHHQSLLLTTPWPGVTRRPVQRDPKRHLSEHLAPCTLEKKNQIKYQTTAWKETSKWASVRWLRFLAPSPGELRSILTPAAGLWKPTDDSRRLPNGNAAFTHQHN